MFIKLIFNVIKNKDKVFKNYCYIFFSFWRFLFVIFRGVILVSFCLYFFRKFIVIFIELFVGVFSSRVRIFNVNILWV